MEPYEYEDEARDKLTVSQGDGGVFVDAGRVFVPTMELSDLCVAMFLRSGQPAPVILPRPEVNPAVSANLGSFGVWLADGGDVVFAFGSSAIDIDTDGALKVAALIAAYAEASRSREPEPHAADVERMAGLFAEASRMAPEDAARYLLRAGVTLPGGDGDRG